MAQEQAGEGVAEHYVADYTRGTVHPKHPSQGPGFSRGIAHTIAASLREAGRRVRVFRVRRGQ